LKKKGVVQFENGDTAAGRKLLWRILEKIASPDFEFADIETVSDRETFVEQFSDGAVKAKQKSTSRASSPKTPSKASPIAPVIGTPRRAGSKDHDKRPTLAPKTGNRVLRVDGARLQSLYSECKSIKLTKNRNSAALLLRVFIELSSEALLTKRKVPIPKKYNQIKWSDIKLRLDVKIKSVAHYLDPTESAKEFQQARLALDPSSVFCPSLVTPASVESWRGIAA